MPELKASPRNRALGLLADALSGAKSAADTVQLPVVGGLGSLLFGDAPELVNDVAYYGPQALVRGGNAATGGIGTFTPDRRILDAAGVVPMAPGAARAAKAALNPATYRDAAVAAYGPGVVSNVIEKNPKPLMLSHGSNETFDKFRSGMGRTAKHMYFTPEVLIDDAAQYGKNIYKVEGKPKSLIDFSDEEKLDAPTIKAIKKAAKDAGITDEYYKFPSFMDDLMAGQLYQSGGGQKAQNYFLDELLSKYDAVKMPDAGFGGSLSKSVVFRDPDLLKILERNGVPLGLLAD